jgi:hypothetical protein
MEYGIRRTVAGLLIWGALSDERTDLSFYRLRTDHTENTASIVDEAYLPLGCLAVDVLLLRISVLRGCVYRRIA